MPKQGDLEVHWVPQVPMKPFRVPVRDLREAWLLLNTLADYDLFQYSYRIKPDYCNIGSLVTWDETCANDTGDCWCDWCDEESGDDFDAYCESHPELADNAERKPGPHDIISNLADELKRLRKLASLVTIRQVISAGDEYIDAAGLNPWCLNEGLATGDERISMDRIDSVLRIAGVEETTK